MASSLSFNSSFSVATLRDFAWFGGFILCRLFNKDLPPTSHRIGSFMSEETSLDKRVWGRSGDNAETLIFFLLQAVENLYREFSSTGVALNNNIVVPSCFSPMSLRILLSHTPCEVALAAATYSASAEDCATIFSFSKSMNIYASTKRDKNNYMTHIFHSIFASFLKEFLAKILLLWNLNSSLEFELDGVIGDCGEASSYLTELDLTGPPESFFEEEENEKQILLPPLGMVFDTEAFETASNSSKQTISEIEFIEVEASQRWPEGLQVEEMEQEAVSTLKTQGVFDVEAVKMAESSGQMKFQIADKEMEPEADRPQEAQQFLMQVGLRLTEPPKDEDWENANEIYLMDNELSVLPENPKCPKLSALFLQRNYKLRLIPPAFFNYMPALQILNLSGTNIKSLPNSIIRLVSLKRLFLNDCHCFMVLSPKIGELKQLEVLSLEGTEIMDLPPDIKKLTNLTCLEVSFCECQSNCKQAMQLNAVVPCGVISVLSQLEELDINVDPDDERWDACVEDIVNEVCTLKRLYSLKFYFQRVELLSHIQWNIPSLLYFRFTVGRHVKRIMSGVPRDVEFELERWDRCLKYINGVDVPRDIKKVLQHATAFFLDRHATVKKLSNFGIQNMVKLKCLVMGECSEVQVIIDEADGYEEDDSDEIVSESYDTEKIVLGSLEYMYVYYMESLRSMWEGPLQPESLVCLKSLTLCTCPQLTTIFTPGLLANLCNLEELKVDDCPSIKSIVSHDITAEHKISYFLPELKKISLHYMPELVSISKGLHIAPKLEWLSFYACPKLKNPLVGEVSSQCLKKIKGETSWWEALEWSNGRPGYLDEIFVPIDIWDC
uniref:Disease resistance protein n=1 Tax=Quercus lobata TaxID=97700 RepID=A0A7N2R0G0_QUELO